MAPSVRLEWNPVEGAGSYQLMVYDRTDAETVTDEAVRGTERELAIGAERAGHDLVMRVRALDGAEPGEWSEFRPLPLELLLGERRDPGQPLALSDDPGLLLLFTVDTECSVLRQPCPNPDSVVDELIFGDFGDGRAGGVGLHMDLLEHFGFRGCFFVDVLMEFEHGQAALERIVEAILGRGHEVELHVHPEHLQGSRDPRVARIGTGLYGGRVWEDRDLFGRLIELSAGLFERRVGRPPLAYRAGGFRMSDVQFAVLAEHGIRIDSSVQPYFNSRVSDWMRMRTQPFRVGGVLEAPPTYLVLDEKPGEWETRALAPNPHLGDPVSCLPALPDGPPRVATFVSHSFQLLRRRESDDPAAIDAFARRLRSALPEESTGRYLQASQRAIRTFGPDVDDVLVAAVAGILRRVADRPDARCVTYAELAAVAGRFWPGEAHPPTDPVPTVDRNRGETGVTGTRIYGPGLLTHLAARGPVPRAPGPGPAERVGEGEGAHEPGTRRVRFRPLGVAPPAHRGALPPLAEVLFPVAAIAAESEQLGTRPWKGLPWDGTTFKGWLAQRGFDVVAERAAPRPAAELAALEPFAGKLAWLDRAELETEVLELELRPGEATHNSDTGIARVDPTALPAGAAALYESLHPGEETRLRIPDASWPATCTTRLLALLRAGLEIIDREDDEYTLLRPLDLADIRRFAGL